MQGNYTEPNSPVIPKRGVSITPRIYSDDCRPSDTNSPGSRTIRSRFQTHFKNNFSPKHSNTNIAINQRESDEFFIYGTKTSVRTPIGDSQAFCSTNSQFNVPCSPKISRYQTSFSNCLNLEETKLSNSCSRSGSMNGIQTVRENAPVNVPTFINTDVHQGKEYSNYDDCVDSRDLVANGSHNEEEIEEIIEEEIRTIRKKLPTIVKHQEFRPSQNAAVGDSNINHVKVTENGCLDINNLSNEQLLCLEEMFRKKIFDSMPRKQDLCVQSCIGQQNASTMIRPPSPPTNRNVGMIFKPATTEYGTNTTITCSHQDAESNCGETDEEIRVWFKQRIGYMTEANQELILELACHFKNDRQKFISLLSEVIAKQKVSVGLDCRPDVETKHTTFVKAEFSNNIGVGEDLVSAIVKSQLNPSSSKGINVRPDLKSHSINTDVIMTRTQASMAAPEPVETVEHGMMTDSKTTFCHRQINTDPINNNTFHGQTPSEFLDSFISSSALESASQMYEKRMNEYRSNLVCCETSTEGLSVPVKCEVVSRDIDATDPELLKPILEWNIEEHYRCREASKRIGIAQTQQQKIPVNSYIHASTVGPLRDTGIGGNLDDDRCTDEVAKSKLLLESWEATTELDEKSENKYLVNSSRISMEDINRCMALSQKGNEDVTRLSHRAETIKMREIPTRTEVVMEDYNGVQLSTNCDITVDRIPSGNSQFKRRQVKCDAGESFDQTEAHIIQNSNMASLKKVVYPEKTKNCKPNLTQTTINHNEFPFNVKYESSASRFPREFGFRRTDGSRNSIPSIRGTKRKIPSRTYLFNMNESLQKCCASLSEHFRYDQFGQLDETNKSMFNQITRTWFDLIKSRPNEEDVVKDFISSLYQYSPALLESVINYPDENGSTALHYAVGHGSWRLVNCLLNTHYMDVDKYNFSGYTPLMISAVSQAHTQEDLEVIDKMLNSKNVNLKSRTKLEQTTLIIAARQGSSKIVDLLLLHQAVVNVQDNAGNTAIMCAVDQGHVDVIRKLLACPDIDLSLKDNDGKDVLTIAKMSGKDEIYEMITKRIQDPINFMRTNGISSHRISRLHSPTARYPTMPTSTLLHMSIPRVKKNDSPVVPKDSSACQCYLVPPPSTTTNSSFSWNFNTTLVL